MIDDVDEGERPVFLPGGVTVSCCVYELVARLLATGHRIWMIGDTVCCRPPIHPDLLWRLDARWPETAKCLEASALDALAH